MDLQKILVILGIFFFILIGISLMAFLFFPLLPSSEKYIGVVDLDGEISFSSTASLNPYSIRNMLEDLKNDSNAVGVILNINSGGGGVVESKEIARSVLSLSEKKPVVAYISGVGASGAYYIAAHANYIIADEDSIVGNLGVVSVYTVYKNLLEDKLGINVTVIKSSEYKDIGSPYRSMKEEETQRLQEIVNTINDEIVSEIQKKRGLSRAAIEEIKTGMIFLGSEALQLGLVDELGGMELAAEKIRTVTNTPDAKIKYIERSKYTEEDPYKSSLYYSLGLGIGDSLYKHIGDFRLRFTSPLYT